MRTVTQITVVCLFVSICLTECVLHGYDKNEHKHEHKHDKHEHAGNEHGHKHDKHEHGHKHDKHEHAGNEHGHKHDKHGHKDDHPSHHGHKHGKCPVTDIVIVVDISSSIKKDEFKKIKELMVIFLRHLPISKHKVRIGVVKFATRVDFEFHLGKHDSKEDVIKAVSKMNRDGFCGGSNIGGGIQKGTHDLIKQGRKNIHHVLLVITDGRSNKGPNSLKEAQKARNDGIVTIAVGVGDHIRNNEILEIAGERHRAIKEKNFKDLPQLGKKLAKKICKRPCHHHHKPPHPHYKPTTTTTTLAPVCTAKLELVFVVDCSCSIKKGDFQTVKSFIRNVLEVITIGQDATHVGLVKYSKHAEVEFGLTTFENRGDILNAAEKFNREGLNCGTNTGDGITKGQHILTTQGRKKINRVLVVLTDGKSNQGNDPVHEAKKARKAGTNTIALGIGKDVHATEIHGIAGDKNNVLSAKNVKDLSKLVKDLAKTTCG